MNMGIMKDSGGRRLAFLYEITHCCSSHQKFHSRGVLCPQIGLEGKILFFFFAYKILHILLKFGGEGQCPFCVINLQQEGKILDLCRIVLLLCSAHNEASSLPVTTGNKRLPQRCP
jgi:hypothetical protein